MAAARAVPASDANPSVQVDFEPAPLGEYISNMGFLPHRVRQRRWFMTTSKRRPRAVGLPQTQPAAEQPAGPWGRPELF